MSDKKSGEEDTAFDIPENTEGVMSCHVTGDSPEGYDASDEICHDCADKFTCLPLAVDSPRGLEEARSQNLEPRQRR